MTVYTCIPEWDAMLSCIYDAWSSGKGHQNIRLEVEPLGQYSILEEYVHVDADPQKSQKLMQAICEKISPAVYSQLAYCSFAYEKDALNTIYHVLLLCFSIGPQALDMVHYRDVMRYQEIRKRVGNEIHHFREFLRFHQVRGALYVAHIEPKSRVVTALGPSFEDRMPSEHWMIVDDIHMEAVVHPKDEPCYIRKLTEDEMSVLIETENENDEYTDLWKTFFQTIAIEERANQRCQNNLFPLWMRKHAVEFR